MELIEQLAADVNFRDVGGLRTEDGGFVARGRLFRCGLLTDLPAATRAAIEAELGVRNVIDIRRLDEIDTHPPAEFSTARLHRLPLTPAGVRLIVDPEDTVESVVDWYWRQLTLGEETVREIFELLAADDESAVVIHCHAGKDRTGVVVAMILTVLGVPREAIVDDYAASGENTTDPFFATLPPMYSQAHPEIMEMLLDRIDDEYGSVEGYLKGAGVDDDTIAAVRRRLLRGGDG